jgi:hypothetical protein
LPTRTYSLLDAAKLLQSTRGKILDGELGNQLSRVSPAGDNIDAGITKTGNTLVITGSDGLKDYLAFNLRPWRRLPQMPEIDELTSTDLPRRAFHKGFLLHAARIKRFLGNDRPDHIVGHSLGAAAAQILGTHLAVPTICLASPQVIKRRFLEAASLRSAEHPQWHVFNMAWRKDFVTRGYRLAGLRSLGHRVVVDSNKPNFGIDHFVKDYERLIVTAAENRVVGLPQNWPDPGFARPTRLA